MKYRSQYDLFDPEVVLDDPAKEAEADPDAPDDAYTIGARGNTVRMPEGAARGEDEEDPTKPWVRPTAIILTIVCIALTGWNIGRVLSGPPKLPPPSPVQVKQTLYMGVLRVESYRAAHSVTPNTLQDAGLPVNAGFSYQRVDAWHYRLSFANGGPALEYNSATPKESFFGKPHDMLRMGTTGETE